MSAGGGVSLYTTLPCASTHLYWAWAVVETVLKNVPAEIMPHSTQDILIHEVGDECNVQNDIAGFPFSSINAINGVNETN
jgi:hypothetical protein